MNFKNKFNKFREYGDYFKGLSDSEILELLDSSVEKAGQIDNLSKDAQDIYREAVGATKQSVKLGLNLKSINVKKSKKAFSELKAFSKTGISDEEKQTVDLMIGLIDLFIDNSSSARNW